MGNRLTNSRGAAIVAAVSTVAWLALAGTTTSAQSSYSPPRNAYGQPDMNGIWQTMNTAVWDLQAHPAEYGVPAGQGVVVGDEIPYQPWALEQRRLNYQNRLTEDPEANCLMVGVPRTMYMPYPFRIVQTEDQITILSEYVHTVRNIHLNSEHPPEGIEWWMGDSRGRWEGDTLVVSVARFTGETWLDRSGNFHSPSLEVVERYTMMGPDHIMYEATIDDPEVFTRPWTIRMPLYRRMEENKRLLEYECYAFLQDELFDDREQERQGR